ncbi:hypothetical protein R6Q57_009144 [Mikania cordata]
MLVDEDDFDAEAEENDDASYKDFVPTLDLDDDDDDDEPEYEDLSVISIVIASWTRAKLELEDICNAFEKLDVLVMEKKKLQYYT